MLVLSLGTELIILSAWNYCGSEQGPNKRHRGSLEGNWLTRDQSLLNPLNSWGTICEMGRVADISSLTVRTEEGQKQFGSYQLLPFPFSPSFGCPRKVI